MQAIAGAVGILIVLLLGLAVLAVLGSLLFTIFLALRARWIPVIYNVRSLTRRKVTTGFALFALTLAVAVVAGLLMLLGGIKDTLVSGGEIDNAVVLRTGATSDIVSVVSRDQAKLLAARDEIATDPRDGRPLVDGQVAVLISAARAGMPEQAANVSVRGLSERQLSLHPNARIAEGRFFKPGTSEIVIGRALVGRFVGAQLGAQWYFARRNWTVVGIVDARGGSFASEVWGDVDQVMDAFHRTMYSVAVLRVKDGSRIDSMAAAVLADPKLNLDVRQERKYFASLSNGLTGLFTGLGSFVSIVIALAAALGASIAMYAQVAARTREVGTLRAMGFRRSSILLSFVLESVILGLIAGVLGVAAASTMQLLTFATINFGTFSEVTFHFTLSPQVVIVSQIFGALLGYTGGLLPALRAARMEIVQATRAA